MLKDTLEMKVILGTGLLLVIAQFLGVNLWSCPFQSVFGIPCPGCGLTVAIIELLQGHVRDSLHTHAFAPAFLLALVLILVSIVSPEEKRRDFIVWIAHMETRTGIASWFLTTFMLYWGLRLIGIPFF